MRLNEFLDKKKVGKRLEKSYKIYFDSIERIARDEFKKIIPFMEKRKWNFKSAMGTWIFYERTGKKDIIHHDSYPYNRDKELQDIVELMHTEVPGTISELHEFMPDYSK